MLAVRAALDELTARRRTASTARRSSSTARAGTSARSPNDARFVQATQANMAGTGIATFSDRLRDAVRGGGPFDEDPRVQGFASGAVHRPQRRRRPTARRPSRSARLLHYQDLIKVGLTGNLADYTFVDRDRRRRSPAREVDYNGSPAGYADRARRGDHLRRRPRQRDAVRRAGLQAAASRRRWPTGPGCRSRAGDGRARRRARRSPRPAPTCCARKSLDRNSYDSGDWFNRLDWTCAEDGFGSGLPPAADNEAKWPFMQPLLADPALKPRPADIAAGARPARWTCWSCGSPRRCSGWARRS